MLLQQIQRQMSKLRSIRIKNTESGMKNIAITYSFQNLNSEDKTHAVLFYRWPR